jgi:thiamine-phosphate pyrophosphorylase
MKLRKNLLGKSQHYPVRSPALPVATPNRAYPFKSPRERLATSNGVYLILDRQSFPGFSLKKIERLIIGGKISLIQLRDKLSTKTEVLRFAKRLKKQISSIKMLLIVNDYVDIAAAALADGVHLGQEDLSLKQARKILGNDKIIGITCRNLHQALKAQKEGADYIGIGPIYDTTTKPGCPGIGLKAAAELNTKMKIPYFAIGNIHPGNIEEITAAGIKRVAVCRAILGAREPVQATEQLYRKLKKS